MLFNQLCRGFNLTRECMRFSVRLNSNISSNHKNKQMHIKSGFITSIRLDSGEDISIMRPKYMKSISIQSDFFERLRNNKDLTESQTFVPSIQDTNPLICSVDEIMSKNAKSGAQTLSVKQRLLVYSKLGKIRLTTLVVISTVAGSLMAPVPFDLNIFLLSSFGTFLTSMSANTINQILEVPYDSQMMRTRNRPLVLGKISPLHASVFGILCASGGLVLLWNCNSVAFGFGLVNLLLYTSIYTPLKRANISNTWIGSLVGALPPLIGWSAATGGIHAGGILLASILFCWQFPHFMALSWNLKKDYSRAGYQMASTVNPKLCKLSALRHSVLISIICCMAPMINLTDWCFVIESLPFNVIMCVLAYQFYTNATSSTSRKLFRYTLIHLPILMTLLILNKVVI